MYWALFRLMLGIGDVKMKKKQLVPSRNSLVYYFAVGGQGENRLFFIWDLGKVLVWVWRENESSLDVESGEEYSRKWD